MDTTTERRCRTHGRFSSIACPTCGMPPAADTTLTQPVPARNGRSLSNGAFVFYATKAMPRAGVLPGDRIVMHPTGRAMLTRMLPVGWLEPAAAAPERPACEVEGCTLGDCAACRYIAHLEAQLGAAGQP